MAALKLLQINIRSLHTNKHLLEIFLFQLDIDIVILSETWLKNNVFYISGYQTFNQNRPDGYGGVAILVKNCYVANRKAPNNTLDRIESIEVDITHNNTVLNISSLYIPPNANRKDVEKQFKNFIDRISRQKNTIFGGDINALHPLWDNANRNNARGNDIANLILQTNLHVLNKGHPTRQNLAANNSSAIDISGASPDIAVNMDWEVQSVNLGSDHLPIVMTLYSHNKVPPAMRTRIHYKKLANIIPNLEFDDTNNIEEFEERLENIVSSHTSTIKSTKTNKHWWNDKIKRLWDVKQGKQRVYNANKNTFTATELNNAIKNLRREINYSKKESWNKFTSEIHPQNTIKDV